MKTKSKSVLLVLGGVMLSQSLLPTGVVLAEKNDVKSVKAKKKAVVKKERGFGKDIQKKREGLLKLDKEMLSLKAELDGLNESLKKEDDLKLKNIELKKKENQMKERFESYANKLQVWQMKGTSEQQFAEVLFGSDSFSDMISRAFTFKTLMNAEQEQIEVLQRDSDALLEERDTLEAELEKLKEQKEDAIQKKKELAKKKERMSKELKKLQKDELARIQKEMKEQEERKKRLLQEQINNRKLEELRSLKKEAASINSITSDLLRQDLKNVERMSELGEDVTNSYFIRPAQGRLTSPYGIRPNPFGGSGTEFHTGIDLANPSGTPIIATASGVVVRTVSSNAGYGNFILLQHKVAGKTFHSLYAHLSLIGVKEGESVEQGEVIGLMGSTGRSTGSHLHFEIQDENRQHMNPLPLLDQNEKKTAKQPEEKRTKSKKPQQG